MIASTTHHREDRARTEGWAVTPASCQRHAFGVTWGRFGRDPDCEQSSKEENPVTNPLSFQRGCHEATRGQFGKERYSQ